MLEMGSSNSSMLQLVNSIMLVDYLTLILVNAIGYSIKKKKINDSTGGFGYSVN
jgi:hypothetical protein